jgi:hypothetical protein
MQLTAFGLVYLPLLLIVATMARAWLPALLVGSATFQASSILNIGLGTGTYGISPYTVTVAIAGAVLLARIWRQRQFPRPPDAQYALALWWAAYVLVALVGSLLLPHIFEGVLVQAPMDPEGYLGRRQRLQWGLSNWVQAVNLCGHVVALLFLWQAMHLPSWKARRLLIGILVALCLALVAGLHDRLAFVMQWPRMASFWMSNPGYSQVMTILHYWPNPDYAMGDGPELLSGYRISSPFSEPSYGSTYFAGATLGLLTWAIRGAGGRWVWVLLSLAAAATLNTLGTTGLVAGGVGALALLLWVFGKNVCGLAGKSHKLQFIAKSTGWAIILGLIVGATLSHPSVSRVQQVLDWAVTRKVVNFKNDGRFKSDINALEVTQVTFGLGTGLGGNRSSSFATSLLSNTGLLGAIAFLGMVATLLWRYWRARQLSGPQYFAAAALATAFLGAVLGVPDLNIPFLWAFLFLAFAYCPQRAI